MKERTKCTQCVIVIDSVDKGDRGIVESEAN